MKVETIIRHLRELVKRLEDNDFSSNSEDKAIREAIILLNQHQTKRDSGAN